MVAERLKEIQLIKQSIKANRINEMSTIKQTPQNKNSSIIRVLQTAVYKHQQTQTQCRVLLLCVRLLIVNWGIVDKRVIFISLSSLALSTIQPTTSVRALERHNITHICDMWLLCYRVPADFILLLLTYYYCWVSIKLRVIFSGVVSDD